MMFHGSLEDAYQSYGLSHLLSVLLRKIINGGEVRQLGGLTISIWASNASTKLQLVTRLVAVANSVLVQS